jgi:hypothetical protein
MRVPREMVLAFMAQCDDVVPGEIRRAEDLLDLPPEVGDRITRDLAIEQVIEAQRMETDR